MPRRLLIRIIVGLSVVLALTIGGFWRARFITNPAASGDTMGTRYHIQIVGKVEKSALEQLTAKIDKRLKRVNLQMSTWDPESEISTFNHARSTAEFSCSDAFASVVTRALTLSRETNGAFDPTLQPLLNLWGFGSEGEERAIPTDIAIAAIKQTTGWDMLSSGDDWIRKSEPDLSLALGAIAKGYGVDQLAALLEESGQKNWFVEIGGEVAVHGLSPSGDPWKIGIQSPTTNPMDMNSLQGVVHVTNGAVATSGDYRNYIEENGAIYSHILDPRTGRAVKSATASVTVIALNCARADGVATALFVMGPVEGLAWVNKQPELEAMFLIRDENDEIIEIFSSGFQASSGYSSVH